MVNKKKVIELVEDYIRDTGRVTFKQVSEALGKFIGSIGKQIRELEKLGRVTVERIREGRSWVNYATHTGGSTISDIRFGIETTETSITQDEVAKTSDVEDKTEKEEKLISPIATPVPKAPPVETQKEKTSKKPPIPEFVGKTRLNINLSEMDSWDIIDLMFVYKRFAGKAFPRKKGSTKNAIINALIAKLKELKK